MKTICVLTALILWTIISAPNGSCQTAHTNSGSHYRYVPTDSTKVPNKLIDDCIHYKADAEFYQSVADSTAFQNVELNVKLKEMELDKYKWFGAGWLGASVTAVLIFILAR